MAPPGQRRHPLPLRDGFFSRLGGYAVVGLAATAVHWALLMAFVELAGWPAWQATALGALAGAQVAYAGNRTLTFAHHGPWWLSWSRFQLTAGGGALLSMTVVTMAESVGLHYLAGQGAATVLAMVGTYAVNRCWSFAATRDPG